MGLNKFAMIIAMARAAIGGGGPPSGYIDTAPFVADYFYTENPGSGPTIDIECNAIKNNDIIVVLCNGWANAHITMNVQDTEDGSWSDGLPYTQQQYANVNNDTYSDSMPFHIWTRKASKNYTSLKIRTSGAFYSTMMVLIIRNAGTGIFDDSGVRPTPVTNYIYDNVELALDNAETTYPNDLVISAFGWYSSSIIADIDSNWPLVYGKNDGNPNTNKLVVSTKTTTVTGNYDPVLRVGTGNSSYASILSLIIKGKSCPAPLPVTTNTPTLIASDNSVIDTVDPLWTSGTINRYVIINNKITTTSGATPEPLYYDTVQTLTNQRITIVRAGNANTDGFVIYVNSQGSTGDEGYEAFISSTVFDIKKNGTALGSKSHTTHLSVPVVVDFTTDTTYVFEKVDGVVSLFINGVKCYRQLDLSPINSGTVGFLLNNNNVSINSVIVERWNSPASSGGGGSGPVIGALEPGVDGIFHFNEVDGITLYQINHKFGTVTDDLQITNNTIRATASWLFPARLYVNNQGADQYSSFIRKAGAFSSGLVILYLQSTTNENGYRIQISSDRFTLYKLDSWTAQGLFTHDWTADTKISAKIVGGSLSVYIDDVQVGSVFVDSTPITGGYPGFTIYLGGSSSDSHCISEWTDNSF